MEQLASVFYLVSLGVFGLIFGSFANVVIWRLPRGESLVKPGSHCPHCGHEVRWHDNIPVVSWLVLQARCRDCGESIAPRYPIVEAASALLWVSAGIRFGISVQAGFAIALFYLLLILAFIDLDTMRLPNVLVVIVAASGAVGAVFFQLTGIPATPLTPLGDGWLASPVAVALLGTAVGGGLTLGVAKAYELATKRAGFGWGDIKLIAASGPYLGSYVLVALLFGSLLGVVGGIPLAVHARGEETVTRRRVPFGPFLAAGIVLTVLVGPAFMGWYLSLFGLGA